jgi:hypothetical protein
VLPAVAFALVSTALFLSRRRVEAQRLHSINMLHG